ncbi:Rossmann-fold NAD(P)-binding domain-containing protein [Mycobacterium sp. HUMS_1102779]|uniref:hypothetical protein n=1 Tax=Mycobacterium sp. HUMS_1102779 TaxID=3383487 RepID=UPI00389A4929
MLPAYLDPTWLRHLPVLPLDRSFVTTVVHADDVADAFVRAIERRAGGAFNLAGEPPVHREDVADALGAKPVHVPAAWMRPLVRLRWLARLQPIDQGWFDLAFSAPLLDTRRAREVSTGHRSGCRTGRFRMWARGFWTAPARTARSWPRVRSWPRSAATSPRTR